MLFDDIDLFGQGQLPQNQASLGLSNTNFVQAGAGKITLFLFTPKVIPDQWRRPHLYSFQGEMRMAVDDYVNRAATSTASNSLSNMLLDVPIARSAILPSVQGQHINLKNFCDNWTFILILDSNQGINPLGIATSSPSRMFYTGWIMGEPATRSGAGWVFNPAAVFVTTHHTTLIVHDIHGNSGTYRRIDATGDYDYFNGQMMQQISSPHKLYELQPSKVTKVINSDNVGATVTGMSENFFIAPREVATDPDAVTKAVEVSTDINRPTTHLQKIIGGLVDSVKMVSVAEERNSPDIFTGGDVLLNTFSTIMGSGSRNVVFNDFKPENPFTYDELYRKYGAAIQAQVIEIPRDIQYNWIDAAAPNRRNVFISIVNSALPSMMVQHGLCEIGFSYDSLPSPTEIFPDPINKGVFMVTKSATLYQTTDATQRQMIAGLERDLRMCLFPIIRQNGGEFAINAFCSLAGSSFVNIKLHDEIVTEPGLQESNNLLGGINTPFLGTEGDLSTNAGELYHVLKDTSTAMTPSLFDTTLPSGPNLFGMPTY